MTTVEAPLQEGATTAKVPRVVIVGGGFGGFYAARALAKAPVQITLVDRRNYHLFRPMLYQVATGLLSADEIAPPLRVVFSGQKNVDVVLSEVTGVDTVNRRVLLQVRPALRLPDSGDGHPRKLFRPRRMEGDCSRTRWAGRCRSDSHQDPEGV